MTAIEEFHSLSDQLRLAVASGDFRRSGRLLAKCRLRLDAALECLPGTGPEAMRLVQEAADLLEWSRRMALIGRSQAEFERARLTQKIPLRDSYGSSARARSTWELEG